MSTGNLDLMKYLLQSEFSNENKNAKDGSGNTAFHLVVKSGKVGTTLGEGLIRLLLHHKFPFDVRDSSGKLPRDYLTKRDPAYLLLSKQETPARVEDSNVLKERGNTAFKNGNHASALKCYSSAIEIERAKPVDPHAPNRNLAILYGNRSQTYYKISDFQNALVDARECVSCDGHWFKAHLRVAKAYSAMKNDDTAFQAFKNAFSCLECDAPDSIQVEILTDLMVVKEKGQIITKLDLMVMAETWARVSLDLIQKKELTAAENAFECFKSTPARVVEMAFIDVRPLCNLQWLRGKRYWIMDLVIFFLACSADHKRMSVRNGDTYFHAAVEMTMHLDSQQLLNFVLENYVLPTKEHDIRDSLGQTALHVAARDHIAHIAWKTFIIEVILKTPIDPWLKNKEGKLALEYLKKSEYVAKKTMETHMGKSSSVSRPVPVSKKAAESKPEPNAKSNKNICDWCEETMVGAADKQEENPTKAIEMLCRVLKKTHTGQQHEKNVADSSDMIAAILGNSFSPRIPESLLDVTPEQFMKIVDTLQTRDKWRQLFQLAKEYTGRNTSDAVQKFGKSLSLTTLLSSSSLRGNPQVRHQILNFLLKHGCTLTSYHGQKLSPLQTAVHEKDYMSVDILLKAGADPLQLTLADGDTPMHAAVMIGLDKEKGNLLILGTLFEMHQTDPVAFSYLSSSVLDERGDSLLHLAAHCKYNRQAMKVTEYLCKQGTPADIPNKDGRLPSFYITKKDDRRTQFLKLAVTTGKKDAEPSAIPKGSKVDKDSSTADFRSSKKTREEKAMKHEMTASTTKSSVRDCKHQIVESIHSLPDVEYKPGAKKAEAAVEEKEKALKKLEPQPVLSDVEDILIIDDESRRDATIDRAGETSTPEGEPDELDNDLDDPVEVDVSIFDNLEWEVECTADVWKTLQSRHRLPKTRKIIVEKIRQLASGDWLPHLRNRINNVADSLLLYSAKFSKGSRILWELAVAFSPRCSETAERRLDQDSNQPVKGGRIYSEVIRIWDIVFDHDNLHRSVKKISQSHDRGETCILQKHLHGIDDKNKKPITVAEKRYPKLFVESEIEYVNKEDLRLFYPPASSIETEYHILKFYTFDSNLVRYILQNIDEKVDFPFRVTDLEHAIINLQSKGPILLLGRSGTGKTTCCLYRLWAQFISYWSKAREANAPLLPRSVAFQHQRQSSVEDEEEEEETSESSSSDTELCASASAVSSSNLSMSHVESSSEANINAAASNLIDASPDKDEEEVMQYDHLHQLFVTKNGVLCTEVLKNFRELSHASEVAQDNVFMDEGQLPHCFQDMDEHAYPLFLTSRQLFLMLDASLPEPFFSRKDDGSLEADIHGWTDADRPLNFIPSTEDDSDYEDENVDGIEDGDHPEYGQAPCLDPRREVTYEVFAEELWPRLTKKSHVDYHPTLIWMEIMSFIKGSFEALSKAKGYLEKDEYIDLGRKRAPNFSGERDRIYDMFLRYEHMKKQKFLFDECDFIFNISDRLQKEERPTWVIHQLFVDETQDFTQAELFVLIRMCKNPNDMFLTGDTAQSIMRGVSFRFSDLKSLFYYAQQSMQAMGKTAKVEVPKRMYQLTHNYRSHAGILALASGILDILVEFFPESFDRLAKDQGLFFGPKPVLLESCSFSDLALLLRGNKRKTSHIEFGAHQVILVANDAARERIPEELRLGLILTIFEAKGLEFDDVLLYNFFKDSQATKEWRVISEYLAQLIANNEDGEKLQENIVEIDLGVMQEANRPRPLKFNPNQHKVLNSELKHLYTALTRARVNVWIFDESEENRAPMFEYFKARRMVQTLQVDIDEEGNEELSEALFAEKSDAAEWIKRGEDFMKHCLYEVAAKCYQRAGDERRESLALAHHRALKASRMKDNPRAMREEFLFAARQLLSCGLLIEAAKCLRNARELEMAAQVYEKAGELEQAAILYRRLKQSMQSSRCYETLGKFHRAVEVLSLDEKYDIAVDTVERYNMIVQTYKKQKQEVPTHLREHQPKQTIEQLSYQAANQHHRNKNHVKMLEALERLPERDERIDFLQQHGHLDLALEILERDGHYLAAAKLFKEHGNYLKAAELAGLAQDLFMETDCLFMHCQQKILSPGAQDTTPENVKKEVEILKNVLETYKKHHKIHYQAITLLLLYDITRDEMYGAEAMMMFGRTKPVPVDCGEIEAVMSMIRFQQTKSVESLIDLKDAMNKIFVLLSAILKPSSNEDNIRIELCEQFYNMTVVDEKTLQFIPCQSPRCSAFLSDVLIEWQLEKKGRYKPHQPVTLTKEAFCENLKTYLIVNAKNWITSFLSANLEIKKANSLCRKYIAGFNCPKDGECKSIHQPYTKDKYLMAIRCWLAAVDFVYTIDKGLEHDALRKQKDLWASLEVNTLVTIDALLEFLIPLAHHQRVMSEGTSTANAFVTLLRRGNIDTAMQRYLNTKWKRCSIDEKVETTDIFFTGVMISVIFGGHLRSVKHWIDALENEVNQDARAYAKKPGLIEVDYRQRYSSRKQQLLMCKVGRFLESLELLYSGIQRAADALESLIKYTKFLVLVSGSGNVLLPNFGQYLFWMEFFTTVAFCLYAAGRNACFYLPANYLALVHFVDACFQSKGCLPLQSVVNRFGFKSPDRNFPYVYPLQLVQERLDKIVQALCRPGKNGLSFLETILSSKTHIRSGTAERAVVLCLTLLGNTGNAVSENSERDMTRTLASIDLTAQKLPKRLRQAFSKYSDCSGEQDIVALLQQLLQDRQDEYLYQCSWKLNKGQYIFHEQIKDWHRIPEYFFHEVEWDRSSPVEAEYFDLEEDEASEPTVTQEELERARKKHEDYQLKMEAAAIILRWYRALKARRASKVEEEVVDDEFSKFTLDATMCGICGVAFESDEPKSSARKSEFDSLAQCLLTGELVDQAGGEGSVDSTKISSHPADLNLQREAHERSPQHRQNSEELSKYKTYYLSHIQPLMERVTEFIDTYSLSSEEAINKYSQCSLDVNRLLKAWDNLAQERSSMMQNKNWARRKTVISAAQHVQVYYQKVHDKVIQAHERYQQTHVVRGTHDTARNEANDDDHDFHDSPMEIEDVVQAPEELDYKEDRKQAKKRKGKYKKLR